MKSGVCWFQNNGETFGKARVDVTETGFPSRGPGDVRTGHVPRGICMTDYSDTLCCSLLESFICLLSTFAGGNSFKGRGSILVFCTCL